LAVLACSSVVISAPAAAHFVDVSSHETAFFAPAQAAGWLNQHAANRDAIWVLSDDAFSAYALATYLQRPFDTIQDERLDSRHLAERLDTGGMVDLVELYQVKDALPADERVLLAGLESGRIPARRVQLDQTCIWLVPAAELAAIKP